MSRDEAPKVRDTSRVWGLRPYSWPLESVFSGAEDGWEALTVFRR